MEPATDGPSNRAAGDRPPMIPRVLVIGRQAGMWPEGLPESRSGASYVFAEDAATVRTNLPESDVVFYYGSPRHALRDGWTLASRLRWIQVAGVGVDWVLFPDLIDSDVTLTNSRGVFDVTLPEYLLALMLALVKDLPGLIRAQTAQRWENRTLEPLAGGHAVIVGAGSIGRAAAGLLRAVGLEITLVGRTRRDGHSGEGVVRAITELPKLLTAADWLILVVPLTAQTHGLIGAAELGLLPIGARLVNIGRGPVLAEAALVEALRSGALAGAALDVFETEPLPADSPLWAMPNVIVSPHIGGDVSGTSAAFSGAFLANLERYIAGRPLENVVDKRLGYVPSM